MYIYKYISLSSVPTTRIPEYRYRGSMRTSNKSAFCLADPSAGGQPTGEERRGGEGRGGELGIKIKKGISCNHNNNKLCSTI